MMTPGADDALEWCEMKTDLWSMEENKVFVQADTAQADEERCLEVWQELGETLQQRRVLSEEMLMAETFLKRAEYRGQISG